jgi:hypothetical protein
VGGLDKERGEAQDPDIHHLLLYCPCFVGWNIVAQLTSSRTFRAAPYKWPISGFVGAALAIFFGGELIDLISSYMTKHGQGRQEPEYRLPAIIISGVTGPMGILLFGLTVAEKRL